MTTTSSPNHLPIEETFCGNCRFWQVHDPRLADEPESNPKGTCRRNAPVVLLIDGQPASVQPETEMFDFCGEFQLG